MASLSRYKITHPQAPRLAADPLIAELASRIRDQVAARTPHGATGQLAAGWQITKGRAPALYIIHNPTPYAAYVEYGTANMPAEPSLGPVVAGYRR